MKIKIQFEKDEINVISFPLEDDPNETMGFYPVDLPESTWNEIEKQLEKGEMPDELIATAPKELADRLRAEKEEYSKLSFSEKVKARAKARAESKGCDELAQMMIIPNKVDGHNNVVALKTIIDHLRLDDSGKITVTDVAEAYGKKGGVEITIT